METKQLYGRKFPSSKDEIENYIELRTQKAMEEFEQHAKQRGYELTLSMRRDIHDLLSGAVTGALAHFNILNKEENELT